MLLISLWCQPTYSAVLNNKHSIRRANEKRNEEKNNKQTNKSSVFIVKEKFSTALLPQRFSHGRCFALFTPLCSRSFALLVCVSFPSTHSIPSDKINSIRKYSALKECFFFLSFVSIYFSSFSSSSSSSSFFFAQLQQYTYAALLSFCRVML